MYAPDTIILAIIFWAWKKNGDELVVFHVFMILEVLHNVFQKLQEPEKETSEDMPSRKSKWKVNFHRMGTCSPFTV